MVLVTCGRDRAHGDTMEAIGEGHDAIAAFHLASQLQGRFHAVGAGRAGKLHFVVQATGVQDVFLVRLNEIVLGGGKHIQALADTIAFNVLEQRFLENVVVVAIVQ